MLKEFFNEIQAGIVSTEQWLFMPNGQIHQYFWCADWRLITDADVPKTKFRSSERWALIAVVDEQIKFILPGCIVHSFAVCEKPPQDKRLYIVA